MTPEGVASTHKVAFSGSSPDYLTGSSSGLAVPWAVILKGENTSAGDSLPSIPAPARIKQDCAAFLNKSEASRRSGTPYASGFHALSL